MINPRRIELPDPDLLPILKGMTPTERLAIAGRMWISARDAVLCHLRADHPSWTESEIRSELLRRMCHGDV
jgi:hypothetical protein